MKPQTDSIVYFYVNRFSSLTQKLPVSQACGVILGYEIRRFHDDKPAELVNLSTSLSKSELECDKIQCHYLSSIKDTTSVSLSAYNAHGATEPLYLPKHVTGISWPTTKTHF